MQSTAAITRPSGEQTKFKESVGDAVRRTALGIAWGLKPGRAQGFLPGLAFVLGELALQRDELPEPESALMRPAGLCGVAQDLRPQTLISAYRRSLFPFAHVGPFKWWSPAERNVLFFNEFHIQRTVRRLMRNKGYSVTFDRRFADVMVACAGPRAGKRHLTWIRPPLMRAFAELHALGHAHSIEVWNADGALVGGGYGLALGRVFFTESNFSWEPHASKIGNAVLNYHLANWGFVVNDNKAMTPTSRDHGFRDIPRAEFRRLLEAHAGERLRVGRWQVEANAKEVADWQPGAGQMQAAK